MIELMQTEELDRIEEELAPKPLKKGIYSVILDEVTEEVSSNSGKRMLKWTFSTVNCADPAHNGRKFFNYTVLPNEYGPDEMDKNGGKTLQFWAMKGLSETIKALDSDYSGGSFDETDLSPWAGKECKASIIQDDYEGTTNNKIGRLLPA